MQGFSGLKPKLPLQTPSAKMQKELHNLATLYFNKLYVILQSPIYLSFIGHQFNVRRPLKTSEWVANGGNK